MRNRKHSILSYVLLLVIWVQGFFYMPPNLYGAHTGTANRGTAGTPAAEVDSRIPKMKQGQSYLKVMSIDLLVPGGGHFYLGNYYSGAAFAGLKLAGIFSLYYFYNELGEKRDGYHSAQADPSAGDNQIERHKREYERAHQHTAFAVIGTAAVYISSLIFNYSDISLFNDRAIPAFDTGCSGRVGEREIFLGFNLRI